MLSNALCTYLRVIAQLKKQQIQVRGVDIAAYMGYSRASVCKALHRLEEEGMIMMEHHHIVLCEQGEIAAQCSQKHYDEIYSFLKQCGFSAYDADAYATKCMSVLDDEFFHQLHVHS